MPAQGHFFAATKRTRICRPEASKRCPWSRTASRHTATHELRPSRAIGDVTRAPECLISTTSAATLMIRPSDGALAQGRYSDSEGSRPPLLRTSAACIAKLSAVSASCSRLLASVSFLLWEPGHGPVILSLSASHGIHTGDLAAVPLFALGVVLGRAQATIGLPAARPADPPLGVSVYPFL
jgi:hypothetical protein